MGGRQIRPARVFKNLSQQLQHQVMEGHTIPTPPWYHIMSKVPPTDPLLRTIAQGNPKKNLYRPKEISYPEDKLRKTFFHDHPWELARPRIVMETDGKDYQYLDWSKGVRQPGIALTGENVVQRQMWLMNNKGMSKNQAYDVARREFYRLRQEEQIEKRVAVEEARHVGGYFAMNRMDVGMQLESQEFENWKIWARKQTALQEARQNEVVDSYQGAEDSELGDESDSAMEIPAEGQSVAAR